MLNEFKSKVDGFFSTEESSTNPQTIGVKRKHRETGLPAEEVKQAAQGDKPSNSAKRMKK